MRARLSAMFVALLLLVAALGTAGCGGSASDTHMLDGSAWRLTAWTLSSLHPSDFTITAKFADDKISGTSAVNAYGGPYYAGPGSVFSVGGLAVTAMGGTGLDMRAEQTYLKLLREAKSFKRSGGRLTLFDQHDNESLVFKTAAP